MREHELILGVVRERTDPEHEMPTAISRFDLVGRSAGAGVEKEAVGGFLEDLERTDHLVSWETDAQMWHYPHGEARTLPEYLREDEEGTRTWLCLAKESRLQRAIVAEAGREMVNQDVIGRLNQALSAIDGDGDGDG